LDSGFWILDLAEMKWILNHEWTRIHTNAASDFGFWFNTASVAGTAISNAVYRLEFKSELSATNWNTHHRATDSIASAWFSNQEEAATVPVAALCQNCSDP